VRIHVLMETYPALYKPYYDAQIADLLHKGHDVSVFAARCIDRTVSETVRRLGLTRRTRYYPERFNQVPARLRWILAGSLALGRQAPGRARAAAARLSGARARMAAAARALALGAREPDLCIVHTLTTATHFHWLRYVYRRSAIAVYYHGGEVPLIPRVRDDAAARGFSGADAVFTNTRFSGSQALERGCPADRLHILPVGFPLDQYTVPPDREYRPGDVLRLISVGRMSEEKGLLHALEALGQVVRGGLGRVSYTLVGEGQQRPALERYVRQNGLGTCVRFLGALPIHEVRRALAAADALLLPSVSAGNWAETQACAVQEAMLMGALVIASRTGGVPESIPPRLQRFLVPERDAAALADAISRLAAVPAQAFRSEAEDCRRFVAERYDVSRLDDELLQTTLRARRSSAL